MEGLGLGDVLLLGFIGAVGGIWAVFFSLLIGSVVGLLFVIPLILKHRTLNFAVPFGPFLAVGAFIGIVFKDYLLKMTGFVGV